MSVAIICACLPQIRPLIVKLFPRIMPASNASKDRPKLMFGSSILKSCGSRQLTGEEGGRWIRIECQDDIKLSSLRHGDIFLETPTIPKETFSRVRIKPMVGNNAEYSENRIDSWV